MAREMEWGLALFTAALAVSRVPNDARPKFPGT